MGVIKRNSIISSILTYFGLLVGAFNTLYLFPMVFTPSEFGLVKVILDFGNIWLGFAPLATIGLISRFNPYYKDNNTTSDFFTWIMVINLVGALASLAVVYFFKGYIIEFFSDKSSLLVRFLPFVLVYCILYQVLTILETFSVANYRQVFPTILREILNRVIQTMLAVLLFLQMIRFEAAVKAYVFIPIVSVFLLGYYLYSRGFVRFNFTVTGVTKSLYKEMAYFSTSLFAGNIFLMLANSLDSVLISGLIGLDNAAVFILSSYIVTLISIPHRTISNISTPVLAESWKHGDVKNIESIYKKSSITLFASTYFMFILIWLNLDYGYAALRLPEIYQTGKYIVLLLGLAKVIDMGFGLNHEIMISSKYWKQNFYIQVVLIIVFIPVNYFSILRYGIVGPAISNLVLMLLYNLFRSYFIWNKFRLSPFTMKILYCLLAGAGLYVLADLIPAIPDSIILNMIIQSVFFFVFYVLFLYKFEISPDINGMIDNMISKIKKRQ